MLYLYSEVIMRRGITEDEAIYQKESHQVIQRPTIDMHRGQNEETQEHSRQYRLARHTIIKHPIVSANMYCQNFLTPGSPTRKIT